MPVKGNKRKTKQRKTPQLYSDRNTKQLYSNRTPAKQKQNNSILIGRRQNGKQNNIIVIIRKKIESTSCTEDSTSSLKHNNNSNKIATPVSLHNALVCGLDRGVCVNCKKPHVSAQLIDGIRAKIKKNTHNT